MCAEWVCGNYRERRLLVTAVERSRSVNMEANPPTNNPLQLIIIPVASPSRKRAFGKPASGQWNPLSRGPSRLFSPLFDASVLRLITRNEDGCVMYI